MAYLLLNRVSAMVALMKLVKKIRMQKSLVTEVFGTTKSPTPALPKGGERWSNK